MPQAGKIDDKARKERLALLDQALAIEPVNPDIAAALARQLASGGDLPLETRLRIVAALQKARPADAAELGAQALQQHTGVEQGSGFFLQALGGSADFPKTVAEPIAEQMEPQDTRLQRRCDLAMAVALYRKPDIADDIRRRVTECNAREAAKSAEFAKELGDDTEMLDTSPYIDAEALLSRLGWLAYLSRIDAKIYGAQFLKEWLMCEQYQDYCWRTVANFTPEGKQPSKYVVETWTDFSTRFGALQQLTRPDAEALLTTAPAAAAAGLARVRFSNEVRAAINLLGNLDRAKAAPLLNACGKIGNARPGGLYTGEAGINRQYWRFAMAESGRFPATGSVETILSSFLMMPIIAKGGFRRTTCPNSKSALTISKNCAMKAGTLSTNHC